MATGNFLSINGQKMTTYNETAADAERLIDDYYAGGWQAYAGNSFARSLGTAGYQVSQQQMFDPIFGKELQIGIMTSDSVVSAIGSKAYNIEGMRLIMSKNTYSQAKDFTRGGSPVFDIGVDKPVKSNNQYLGIGAATVQDGKLTDGTMLTPDQIRVPYKEIPMNWNYGLGLMALESRGDDTGSHEQYMAAMSDFYADEIDKALLRPVTDAQPRSSWFVTPQGDVETSLTPIRRIVASGLEVGKTYKDAAGNNVEITPALVTPWDGINSQGLGTTTRRFKGASAVTASSVTGTVVRSNYDSQILDAEGRAFSLEMINTLHTMCMQNRKGMKNNKKCFYIMSPMMWNKLNMLALSNRIYQTVPQMYANVGVGGMETVEGQDGAISFNSYLNQPILVSPNMAYDYEAEAPSNASFGDLIDLEGEYMWMSLLTPMDMWTFKNPAVTMDLEEKYLLHMREELRANKFNGSGALVNVLNE